MLLRESCRYYVQYLKLIEIQNVSRKNCKFPLNIFASFSCKHVYMYVGVYVYLSTENIFNIYMQHKSVVILKNI